MTHREQESPTGDVQYDEKALEDAEERMHAQGTGGDGSGEGDPPGGHDPDALRDAGERMTRRPATG